MKTIVLALVVFALTGTNLYSQFTPSGQPEVSNSHDRTGAFIPTEEYRKVVRVDSKHFDVQAVAAPNPSHGPNETFIYENAAGFYKIADMTSVNGGSAKYRWKDGARHEDRLTYLAHGYIEETEGYSIPRGTKVSVWAYRAEDEKGNHFFIYFGTEDIIRLPQGRRYPLYYSFGAPGTNDPTYRWVTSGGTTRK